MRQTIATALLAALCLGLGSANAADDSFETNFAKAEANARTTEGAAFDALLAKTYEAMPEFAAKVEVCLRGNPGPHKVRGYIRFISKADFEVVLEPRDAFSGCLSQALASPSLPPPPGVPYLNPFTFSI